MSPDFFNLYSEVILREIEDRQEGITINGCRLNNLHNADDTVLMATSVKDLQRLFDAVVKASEHLGLRVNSKETKCKMVSKSEVPPTCSVKQRKKETQQVSPFNHLGALVNSDARCKKEI